MPSQHTDEVIRELEAYFSFAARELEFPFAEGCRALLTPEFAARFEAKLRDKSCGMSDAAVAWETRKGGSLGGLRGVLGAHAGLSGSRFYQRRATHQSKEAFF